jgi:hypothetical protein
LVNHDEFGFDEARLVKGFMVRLELKQLPRRREVLRIY